MFYNNQGFDVWSVALAFCLIDDVLRKVCYSFFISVYTYVCFISFYLEQGFVRKDTLAVCCGCCYLLAVKFNEMMTPASVKSLRDVCSTNINAFFF